MCDGRGDGRGDGRDDGRDENRRIPLFKEFSTIRREGWALFHLFREISFLIGYDLSQVLDYAQ